MSYYILPKNNKLPDMSVLYQDGFDEYNGQASIFISNSLANYYCQMKQQIDELFIDGIDLSDNSFDAATRVINPYEFIFSKVPGSKYSVSKLKPHSNLFYDLLEISMNISLFEAFEPSQQLRCFHVSPNFEDSVECFDMVRNHVQDIHITEQVIQKYKIHHNYKRDYDVIYIEPDVTVNYFESLLLCLAMVMKVQKYNGVCIIKINNMFYKPVVDFLYILTGLYDKVYITKPSSNNITTFDKYVVCKKFRYDEQNHDKSKSTCILDFKAISLLQENRTLNIYGFCKEIPRYFINKIDDLNIIIGHQQLEALDQIVSIYKNKNKYDKIESIKKNNIQKSVLWCEKYKIPCNKFTEKINIFLPIINGIAPSSPYNL